jgi:SAM-dependent methyltransferase
VTAAIPYVLLSATAPLLQARAAAVRDPRPYRLYAWSNAGSFGALLAYPFLVEPWLGTHAQTLAWSGGYALRVALLGAVLWRVRDAEPPPALEVPGRRQAVLWFALAACGTAVLMTVSEAIAQDLSVTPLLWVLPLGLYLLSFVVCFGGAPRLPLGVLALALVGMWWVVAQGYAVSWQIQLAMWCAGLFVVCVALHGALWTARPEPRHLTSFYIWVAAGGAAGGAAVAVCAPLVLPHHLELHGVLVACWLLCGWSWRAGSGAFAAREGRTAVVVGFALVLSGLLGVDAWKRVGGAEQLTRSFYGVLKVKRYGRGDREILHLLDGRISHGFQFVARPHEPTAYFVPHSGIGRLLSRGAKRVGVLGLGVGTLAAYGRAGDVYRFYELNPDVTEVARGRFTFLDDSAAEVDVVPGDARLSLAAEAPQRYDVLAVDAFSGDAIPTHLLTREAIALYRRHLAPGGVLAINVSNRHANLPRVVRAHAERTGWVAHRVRSKARSPLGPYLSDWILLSPAPLDFGEPLETGDPVDWTDDHAPVLPILR